MRNPRVEETSEWGKNTKIDKVPNDKNKSMQEGKEIDK
jgi:hypothetical protein